MKKIDTWLLKLFQSIADWYQSWFGGDNFLLAKAFFVLYWIFVLMSINIKITKSGNIYSAFFIICINAFLTLVVLPLILWGERSCRNNPRFRNPCVVILIFARMIQIVIVLYVIVGLLMTYFVGQPIQFVAPKSTDLSEEEKTLCQWLGLIQEICWGAVIYFGSCTPKPPKEGKLGQFIEKLFLRPATAT